MLIAHQQDAPSLTHLISVFGNGSSLIDQWPPYLPFDGDADSRPNHEERLIKKMNSGHFAGKVEISTSQSPQCIATLQV